MEGSFVCRLSRVVARDDVEVTVDVVVAAIKAWLDQRSLERRIPQWTIEQ